MIDLQTIKGSHVMTLLEFAVKKGMTGKPFKAAEAKEAVPELESVHRLWLKTFCDAHSSGDDADWRIKPDAFMAYLGFLRMEQAEKNAAKASRQALWALRVAVVAVLVTLASLMVTICRGCSPVEISPTQVNELRTAIERSHGQP